ncbi:MAG: STAS/SEC14 domain-containing protein [Planctomycetota bacterium]|nr:STAS/SEC14 domain-containing protein [Planctomycetota bacterium]
MIEFQIVPDRNIIEFVIAGAITRDNLAPLLAACEKIIAEHGKIRMLKQVRSIGHVDLAAVWENLRFGFHHLKDLERVAAVADQAWMGNLAKLANPFLSAEMRFFTTDRIEDARAWLREE